MALISDCIEIVLNDVQNYFIKRVYSQGWQLRCKNGIRISSENKESSYNHETRTLIVRSGSVGKVYISKSEIKEEDLVDIKEALQELADRATFYKKLESLGWEQFNLVRKYVATMTNHN